MSWGQIIIASLAVLLGIGGGILILLRLRAKPVEDPDDLERVRSIVEGLGLRRPPREHCAFVPAVLNAPAQVLAALAIATGGSAL
jgi:hypothetical protein